jgi:hypothetical protein
MISRIWLVLIVAAFGLGLAETPRLALITGVWAEPYVSLGVVDFILESEDCILNREYQPLRYGRILAFTVYAVPCVTDSPGERLHLLRIPVEQSPETQTVIFNNYTQQFTQYNYFSADVFQALEVIAQTETTITIEGEVFYPNLCFHDVVLTPYERIDKSVFLSLVLEIQGDNECLQAIVNFKLPVDIEISDFPSGHYIVKSGLAEVSFVVP